MNCVEFEAALQRGLDQGVLGDDESLQGHCRTCSACRKSWDRARLLAEAIVAWRAALPEVSLVESVAAARAARSAVDTVDALDEQLFAPPLAINAPMAKRNRSSLGRRRSWLAIAAGVAAIVAVAVMLPTRQTPPETSDVARIESPSPRETIRLSDVPHDATLQVERADAVYDALASTAAGALEEFAWIVVPQPAADDQRNSSGEMWLDGLQRELRPIGQSLGDALDFLWEAGEGLENSRT
jgi:hypothetical protein